MQKNVIIKDVKRKWEFCQLSSRRENKTRAKFLSILIFVVYVSLLFSLLLSLLVYISLQFLIFLCLSLFLFYCLILFSLYNLFLFACKLLAFFLFFFIYFFLSFFCQSILILSFSVRSQHFCLLIRAGLFCPRLNLFLLRDF